MAQVIQRTWRSGPRRVRRSAWGYTVQIGGKQERRFDAKWSREDAQDALAARILERDVPQAPAPAPTVTFKAMTERYLTAKVASKKRSIKNDREAVARFLAFFGAATPLTQITGPRIAEYRLTRLTTISDRTGRQLEPASVNRDLSILRGLLRLAADEECGYLGRAPKVKLEKEPEGRLRWLSDDEATRLLAECAKAAQHPVVSCRSPYLHAVVTVALNTGMRKGEILGLTWERVDFARGVILLEKTKTGKRREIPMNRAVYDVLAPLHADRKEGLVFQGTSVRTAFLSACERARVLDFHFHDLRHTFASWLVMRGRPLKEVQELLGHKNIRMTERYAHLAPERLRDAVAALEDFSTTSAQSLLPASAALVSARRD